MDTNFDIQRLDWQDQALCAETDPEIFYPETTGDALHARRVCIKCPVREQCLQAGMDNVEVFGIWGGTTKDDRAAIRAGRGFDIYSKLGKKWMKQNGIERPAEDGE